MAEAQKLPPQVQAAVDKAHKRAAEVGMKNAPEIQTEEPKAEETPETEQPEQPEQPEPQTRAEEAAPEPSDSSQAPPDNVTPIDWEQRYKSLKGRLDAEESRKLKHLEEQVEQMRLANAQLTARLEQPAAPEETPAPAAREKWYTPEQLEDYGEDFFELIDKRVARVEQAYQNKISQLEAQLAQLGQVAQQAQTQPLYQQLDTRFPQWKDMNNDPLFVDWLKSTPVSSYDPNGKTLYAALRENFAQGNLDNVVAIFKAYGKQGPASGQPVSPPPQAQAGPQPGSQPPAPPATAGTGAAGQVDIATLAGPGTPQEPGADPLAQKPQVVWTRKGIQEFYDDVRRGKLTPEQIRATEADLQKAVAEGRYQP